MSLPDRNASFFFSTGSMMEASILEQVYCLLTQLQKVEETLVR